MAIKVSTTGQTTFVKQIKVGTPIKRVAAAPVSGGGGSGIDSSATVNLIDSAYVQARQITYNVLDSADVLAISTADLSSDSDVIAVVTRQIVDSAYVQARVTFPTDEVGLDSTAVIALITENDQQRDSAFVTEIIDSDYIQARQTPQDFAYSSLTDTPNVLDSADVAEIAGSIEGLDSTAVRNLIDSDYVNARVDTVEASGVDSDAIIDLIDSAYVQSRVTFPTDEVGIDSTAVIGLIDSSYVQARAEDYLISANEENQIIPDNENVELGSLENPFKRIYLDSNSVYIGGLILSDSGGQFVVRDLNGSTVSLVPGIELGTVDSADVLTLVDSTYIKSQVTIPAELAAFQDATVSGAPVGYINRETFVNGDLLPLGNHNLGSAVYRWNTIYLKGRTLDLGGLLLSTESDGAGGDLQLGFSFGGSAPQTISQVAASGMRLDQLSDVDSSPFGGSTIVYNGDSWGYAYYIDSAFVTGLPVSTFSNDANYLDSTTVQGVIDATYIQTNQITYNTSDFTDSTYVSNEITSAIDALIDGAPGTLDTLNEIAAALNDDDSAYATLIRLINDQLDSAEVVALIDSDYVQLRQDYAYSSLTGVPTNVSSFTNDANYLDSTTVTGVIDASYVTGLIDTIYLDSAEVIALVDSSYVQDRQIKYTTADFPDSVGVSAIITADVDATFINNLTIDADTLGGNDSSYYLNYNNFTNTPTAVSTFTNDANYLDSTTVTGVIDQTYVTGLIDTTYLDSAEVIALVDSNYVQLRQDFAYASLTGAPTNVSSFTNDAIYLDAAATAALVDSAYVNLRVDANIDSAALIAVIDSDYVQLRQITYTVYTDSDTRSLVDSAYINARLGQSIDSATTLDLIDERVDSSFIQNLSPAFIYRRFQFTANDGQTVFTGNDDNGLNLDYKAAQSAVFLNGILIQSINDYETTDSSTITLVSGADSNDILTIETMFGRTHLVDVDSAQTFAMINSRVDSAYVQFRQADIAAAAITKFNYRATQGQTVFSGTDIGGQSLTFTDSDAVQIFYNGTLVIDDGDFDPDPNAGTVTLNKGVDSGDIVSVMVFSSKKVVVELGFKDITSNGNDISHFTSFSAANNADILNFNATGHNFTVSTDPNTNSVIFNANVLDSAEILQLTAQEFNGDSSVVGFVVREIVDSNYIQAREDAIYTAPSFESTIKGIIDSDYIGRRSTDSNEVAHIIRQDVTSNFLNVRLDSDYIRTYIADSAFVKGFINADYMRSAGADSNYVKTIATQEYIRGLADSNYIKTVATQEYIRNLADSTYIDGVIVDKVDDTFINNLVGDQYLDSDEAINLIDSDYIQVRKPYTNIFNIVNNGSSSYLFSGDGFITSQNNPTLYLLRGQIYKFDVNAPSHPFRIETSAGLAYNNGVTNNAAAQGEIIFEVPWYAPDTLYYRCTVHSNMVGTIEVLTSPWLDSDDVISLIDSDYVELRQIKYTDVSEFANDANYLDSITVTGVIDGIYINNLVDATQFLDSDQVIDLIDSDYVSARVPAASFTIDVYADSNDLVADELLEDSTNTISMKGGIGITLTTEDNEVKISQTSYSYVMATLFG